MTELSVLSQEITGNFLVFVQVRTHALVWLRWMNRGLAWTVFSHMLLVHTPTVEACLACPESCTHARTAA